MSVRDVLATTFGLIVMSETLLGKLFIYHFGSGHLVSRKF